MSSIAVYDKEPIVLDGSVWGVSAPYKLPNSEHWCVSIKDKASYKKGDLRYILTFVNKIRADIFKRGNVNVIKLIKFDVIENGVMDTLHMSSQKDMDLYIDKKNNRLISPEDVMRDKKKIASELFGNELSEDELFGEDTSTDNLNINEMLDAWEDYFEDRSEDATTKAKQLLASISDHYLTRELLQKDIYIRNKLMMQAESLSMLFMQLSLTKQLLMKFFKEIMADVGNKATYDAFAQQQKFVFEINKYMNETISDIISDMKQAKDREKEKELEEEERTMRQQAMERQGGGTLITTRNKKLLLAELGELDTEFDEVDEVDEVYVENYRKKREEELKIKPNDF